MLEFKILAQTIITFDVLPPLLQVFLEAESVLVAEIEVFLLVFVVAGLPPEVVSVAAELSLEVVSAAAELSLEVVSAAAELSLEVVSAVAELSLEVVVLAAEPVFDVAEPQVSVDIAVAFVVLVPVSVVVVEVDSSGRPKFLAFPNVDHYATSSSSVEVVG